MIAWKGISGAANIIGTKTNNNAAPDSTNLGVLPAIANAAAPSYTEGDQVLLSTDLSGDLRVLVVNGNANGQAAMANSHPVVIASNQSAYQLHRWTWTVQPGNSANTTPWLTTINDGTHSAQVLGGIVGNNALFTAGAYNVASLSAGSLNADLVTSTGVSYCKWYLVHITGTFSGHLPFSVVMTMATGQRFRPIR